MKRSHALIGALTVALSLGPSACSSRSESSERSYSSELALRSLIASFESADTALILDIFSPQATYDDFANQQSYEGLEEIVGYITSVHDWGSDVYMNLGTVHASEASATGEWVFSAVQSRPMGSRLPIATGREVVLNGVTIIEMDGDRIIRAANYTDNLPFWLQLGAKLELPGGGVIDQMDGR
jgi:SnoaL-like domain